MDEFALPDLNQKTTLLRLGLVDNRLIHRVELPDLIAHESSPLTDIQDLIATTKLLKT
jgi:hypothetical protein